MLRSRKQHESRGERKLAAMFMSATVVLSTPESLKGYMSLPKGMKLLPDPTYLCNDPIPSIEILCCAALYLQCLDMRATAYSLVSSMMLYSTTRSLLISVLDRTSVANGRSAWDTHGHLELLPLRVSD